MAVTGTAASNDGHVVVVGSCNTDLIVRTRRFARPGETVAGSDLVVAAGGKSANQAVAAALLGTRTSMVALVGTDTFAEVSLASLTAAGVHTGAVHKVDGATGTAVITVDATGENTIVVSPGANARLDPAAVDRAREVIASADVVALCLESPTPAVVRAARLAGVAGATVVLTPAPFDIEAATAVIADADVVVLNEHECALLLGAPVPDPARTEHWRGPAARFAALGVDRAVVTLGSAGAMVLDGTGPAGREAVHIPAPRVDPVDTTGAGDAFTGALAGRLAAGWTLERAAGFAAAVGAYATGTLGAQRSYPTARQLDSFLAAQRSPN